ncbi:MAG: hypothetical protein Alis3KO_29790 [Aliiglaciecola sp.]
MNTFNARVVFVYVFAFSLFLFHAFAWAELVRGGGRGSRTNSAAEEFFLVNNIYANQFGMNFDYQAINYDSLQSGVFNAGAAPRDCYQTYDFDDPFFVDEPCYYQFIQGDRLQLFGFTSVFFPDVAAVEATWTISQGQNRWMFTGDSSFSDTMLDVMMPDELMPGEYQVSLDYTFFSGPNNTFFYNSDNHNDFPNSCGELIPGDPNSYTCAFDYDERDTLSFGFTERLVVLAKVNSPTALTLMIFGGLLLLRRRH